MRTDNRTYRQLTNNMFHLFRVENSIKSIDFFVLPLNSHYRGNDYQHSN